MRIGFVSLPHTGHLNPMTALARKLQSRGHEIVFISLADAKPVVLAANLNFVPFCESEYPPGYMAKDWSGVAKLQGESLVRRTWQELTPGLCAAALKHLPEKLADARVEALVLDTVFFFLGLVPMHLGMPYAHVWNVLHLDTSGATPPCISARPYETTPDALAQNIEDLKSFGAVLSAIVEVAKPYADHAGLQIDWNDPAATISRRTVVTQTPREFDFPNIHWPAEFHYAGPFQDNKGRESISFPWGKLTGKPLIYASLGTLVNGSVDVYRAILESVGRLTES